MNELDMPFICSNLASLSGIPLRLFKENNEMEIYTMVELPADPFSLYKNEILASDETVWYHVTPQGHYYGVIRHTAGMIVIGPMCQMGSDERDLREMAFLLGLHGKAADGFSAAMRSIPFLGVESFLRMICLVYYYLYGQKKDITDLVFDDTPQDNRNILPHAAERESGYLDVHNTLYYEKRMLDYIRLGDIERLREMFLTTSHGRAGQVAANQTRQAKNIFIITTTLASRASIEGGVPAEEAFGISDLYIQQCELLSDDTAVSRLQWRMVMDYASRTERLRHGREFSTFTIEVLKYIRSHLFRAIHINEMAKELHVDRSYLAVKFKQETGVTLTEYIRNEKITEAKRLLGSTNKKLEEIAAYLGFSSQSHFQNTFKKYAGLTPIEYRKSCGQSQNYDR